MRSSWRNTSVRSAARVCCVATYLLVLFGGPKPLPAQPPPQSSSSPSSTWALTVVMPARAIAGQPAMLAVLSADGRLASGVNVEVGSGQVTTDATGRAYFTVPSTGQILVAKASGAFGLALIDAAAAPGIPRSLSVPGVASLREPFSICGPGFGQDPETVHVRINDQPALVMAASPECLSVFPGRQTVAGPAKITIASAITPAEQWKAATTLIALEPQMPEGKLIPGEKAILKVRVRGSEQRLRIAIENEVPGVLRFPGNDVQQALSSGGLENTATVQAQTIRSGDFSFAAKLLAPPDEDLARAYLQAAVPLAAQPVQKNLNRLVRELDRHPQNLDSVRRGLDGILSDTIAGDFRTVLTAARMALS